MGMKSTWTQISLDNLLGIQSCTQKTKFYTVLDRFWLVKGPIKTQKNKDCEKHKHEH